MVLSELKPNELQALRVQAAEGKLALELEQVRKVHQFHASSADIDAFIENIRQLEFAQKSSKHASYKATGTFETATGKTTFEARKTCFVATACFGDFDHPHVLVLRRFRDCYLLRRSWGRNLTARYYLYGPSLAEVAATNRLVAFVGRVLIAVAVKALRV